MITNMHKNIMGTMSFDGKFLGMRKAQEFIVYPMHGEEARAKIQSDTRIGYIDLGTGEVLLSPSIKSGAYNPHLALVRSAGMLEAAQLLMFKANIFATASGKAGTNGIVYTNNSGALEVFK